MQDEWRYLVNSRDCMISADGEVDQDGHILEPYQLPRSGKHRWVDLVVQTGLYDHDKGDWEVGPERRLVWQLMIDAWFVNWSSEFRPVFLDRNPWNCSLHNIRAESRHTGRLIEVRRDGDYFAFDRRMRGNVEVVELDRVFSGPANAARAIGGTKSGVSRVLSGELETHHGYHFRWVSGYN